MRAGWGGRGEAAESMARRAAPTTPARLPHCAGATVTAADVAVKRPGRGIPAAALDRVIGRVARRDVPVDVPLQWDDLT